MGGGELPVRWASVEVLTDGKYSKVGSDQLVHTTVPSCKRCDVITRASLVYVGQSNALICAIQWTVTSVVASEVVQWQWLIFWRSTDVVACGNRRPIFGRMACLFTRS